MARKANRNGKGRGRTSGNPPNATGRPNRRKQLVLIDRRAEVAKLYLAGLTQTQIAARLGIAQCTVSFDLEAAREEWRQRMVADYDALKSEEIAKISLVWAEAHAAWERSQKAAEERRKKEQQGGRAGDHSVEETVLRGQCGDPRYLAVMDSCIDKMCKIYGFYSAEKHDLRAAMTANGFDWDQLAAAALPNGGIIDAVGARIQQVLAAGEEKQRGACVNVSPPPGEQTVDENESGPHQEQQ